MFRTFRVLFFLACFVFTSTCLRAQQFLGYRSYMPTIANVIYQPSLQATSDKKISVNVSSVSFGLWNNAYDINKRYLLSDASEIGIEGKDFFKDKSPKDKNGYVNIDYIGPSVSYAFKGGHHIGLFTRFREVVSLRGINNEVFQVFNKIDENFYNTTLRQDDLNLNIHSFSEIGINYSHKLYETGPHALYGGISVKYLMGAAAGSLYVEHLNVNLKDVETINKLNGRITVAYSDNVSTLGDAVTAGLSNIGRNTGKASVGMDLGATYELKQQLDNHSGPYLLRASLSVTDIGSIRYTPSPKSKTYTFDADSTKMEDINRNKGETLGQYISRMEATGYITSSEKIEDYKVKLPTALRMNIDWNVTSHFFLNARVLINMLGNKSYMPGYVSATVISARYEKKWYSVGIPVSYNALGDFNFGIALRGGPFFIGSSSIFSSLFSKTISTGNAYAGLAWSF